MSITLKNDHDIAQMRIACRLASEVLDFITPHIVPGVMTEELDRLCHEFSEGALHGSPTAQFNYQPPGYPPYPKTTCISVNDMICHGIPGDKVLKNSDALNIDITVIKDGYFGDTSRMFIVGDGSIMAKRLVQTPFDWHVARHRSGAAGRASGRYRRGHSRSTRSRKATVVREYCGHGASARFSMKNRKCCFTRARGHGHRIAGGHDLHCPADDQRRQAGYPHDARPVDRQDARPQSVHAMGTYRARHAYGL